MEFKDFKLLSCTATVKLFGTNSSKRIPSAYYLFEEGDFSANFGLNLKSLVDEIRGIA
jgi:hypothetical protein